MHALFSPHFIFHEIAFISPSFIDFLLLFLHYVRSAKQLIISYPARLPLRILQEPPGRTDEKGAHQQGLLLLLPR